MATEAMPGDASERLRSDYDQTTTLLRSLTDVRFKLLAFVPTISGAALGLLSHGRSTSELLAVGCVGLLATLGVVLYELRNTQVYDYALARARELERRLGFASVADASRSGGVFSELPGHDVRILGFTAGHDRSLALVYSAAVGSWTYVVAWGALRAADAASAQEIGGAIGAAAGVAVLVEFLRVRGRPEREPQTATAAS